MSLATTTTCTHRTAHNNVSFFIKANSSSHSPLFRANGCNESAKEAISVKDRSEEYLSSLWTFWRLECQKPRHHANIIQSCWPVNLLHLCIRGESAALHHDYLFCLYQSTWIDSHSQCLSLQVFSWYHSLSRTLASGLRRSLTDRARNTGLMKLAASISRNTLQWHHFFHLWLLPGKAVRQHFFTNGYG